MKLTRPVYSLIPREERILAFQGYNKKAVIDDGEMRDMYNLSSDEYPCLYQRKPRGTYSIGYTRPTAMLTKNGKLAVIDKGQFEYDGLVYPTLRLSDNTFMVSINTKICFFPEKKYFDTVIEDIGDLEASEKWTNITVNVTSSSIEFPTGEMLGKFMMGDAIQIKASNKELDISAVIEGVTNTSLTFQDSTFISVLAEGETTKEIQLDSISIIRSCPDLDYVMESNNRLWGVSNKDNTIYACKLGDPTNWTYFQNTSIDSYYAQQGTDGEWTGCAAYSKHLLFFKEDYIHKVYGSSPASYQIESAKCHALEKGSSKSVAIINERVLYKSRLGIMAYSGGVPILISDKFGTDRYKDVIAGTNGVKYIMSVIADGKPQLMTYDMQKDLWHKEDNLRVRDFCYHDGRMLAIDDDTNAILELEPIEPNPEDNTIEWMAMLGPFSEYIEDHKVYSKLKMRFKLRELSEVDIHISMDDGEWEWLEHIVGDMTDSHYVPIVPRRCNKFAIKISGTGYCKIESLVREWRVSTMRGDSL